jgi:hypothetical protein
VIHWRPYLPRPPPTQQRRDRTLLSSAAAVITSRLRTGVCYPLTCRSCLPLTSGTIARWLTSITTAHQAAGFSESPAMSRHFVVGETLKGIRGTVGNAQHGKPEFSWQTSAGSSLPGQRTCSDTETRLWFRFDSGADFAGCSWQVSARARSFGKLQQLLLGSKRAIKHPGDVLSRALAFIACRPRGSNPESLSDLAIWRQPRRLSGFMTRSSLRV